MEKMSRVRLEECENNIRFMPSEVRLKNFSEKYKIRALKFIVYLLNCILGPPNLEVRGGPRLPGPRGPPGSASANSILSMSFH